MIEIVNRQRKHKLPEARFKRQLGRLSEAYGKADADMTVVFCGRDAIQTLNRQYRKKDAPTDVLSFPIGNKAGDGRFYLGDIVIAVPVAERQGREKGHGLTREIEILMVHSFFHLLGYDHENEKDAAKMERKEAEALRLLGT